MAINIDTRVIEINYPEDAHLSTFTQNIKKLSELIGIANLEFSKVKPNDMRLEVYRSDIVSLTEELVSQRDRAIAANGLTDPNVITLQSLMQNEITELYERARARIATLEANLVAIDVKYAADLAALESGGAPALGGGAPPDDPVDNQQQDADDGHMEKRIEKLEADLAAIKLDVGIIKANGATKSDIAETKATISEAKTAIILWVAGAVFLAQVIPGLLKKFGI